MESPRSEEFEFGQTFRVAGEGAPGEKKPKLFPRISYKPRWSIWLRHMQYKDTESHIDQTSCSRPHPATNSSKNLRPGFNSQFVLSFDFCFE